MIKNKKIMKQRKFEVLEFSVLEIQIAAIRIQERLVLANVMCRSRLRL